MNPLRRRMLDPAPAREFRIQLQIGDERREWGLSELLAESLGTSFPRAGMAPVEAGRALLAEHRTWGEDTAKWIAYRGLLDRWALPLDRFLDRFTDEELERFRREFAKLYGRCDSLPVARTLRGEVLAL